MPVTEPRAPSGGLGQVVARRLPGEPPSRAVQAMLVGARIDTRGLPGFVEAEGLDAGTGSAVFVFRYGVVVLFGVSAGTQARIIGDLRDHIVEPVETVEVETATIQLVPTTEEQVHSDGRILLHDMSTERLLLTATVLARSVALARDESQIDEAFDRIDPLVQTMRREGRAGLPIRSVMRQTGEVLTVRHRILGRAQIGEKPDLLWDHPELERLYARLEAEYELVDRAEAIDRKLDAIGDVAEMLLDLVQHKRSVRLELAIIALIAFEIALTLYEKLAG